MLDCLCVPESSMARLYKDGFASAFAFSYSALAVPASPRAAWHSARLSQALAESGYSSVLRANTFSA